MKLVTWLHDLARFELWFYTRQFLAGEPQNRVNPCNHVTGTLAGGIR